MLDFRGRVALVTGAGRGIGRDYALLLAARGARVVVNDVNADRAESVVAEIQGQAGQAVPDSHSVVGEGASIVDTALNTFGQLDAVINNAAVKGTGSFADRNADDWWNEFDISFRGTVEVTRAAWQHLAKSGAGRVINTASTGMLGNAGSSAYGAAKAAVWGLSNTLALEGDPLGIRVHTIIPGAWTPLHEENGRWRPEVEATMREHFTTERVASFVVWLAHPATQAAAAKTFRVGGGHARRGGFGVMPAIRPTSNTPEGWADVSASLVEDQDDFIPATNLAELVTRELITVNPTLESVLRGSSLTN
ncbi:SDR family NAD(P)-dependent oxidoreductase [Rhodococcus opacus]|uniref:Short-chain dehydrogenase n=1 Tax=Rhodococcus opacus TaxID=37919 RepID=A0A2S8J234_RHOOP|nr:SDR family NAD(P)-dependent oxidoreductase [Rhodococcus opacus]PQP21124.1 short-chain dehydrogenase [Rhodococcus opacus]